MQVDHLSFQNGFQVDEILHFVYFKLLKLAKTFVYFQFLYIRIKCE
jgi:hypothetical protein